MGEYDFETEDKLNAEKIFQQELYPYLSELEAIRLNNLKKYNFYVFLGRFCLCTYLVSIVLVLLLLLIEKRNIYSFSLPISLDMLLFILFWLIFPIRFIYNISDNINKNYKTLIKKRMLDNVLSCIGNIEVAKNNVDDLKSTIYAALKRSKRKFSIDRISYDDIFTGEYNNTEFCFTETTAEHVYSTKNGKSVRKVFNGLVLQIIPQYPPQGETFCESMVWSYAQKTSNSGCAIICLSIALCLGVFAYFLKSVKAVNVGIFFLVVALMYFTNKDHDVSVFSESDIESRFKITTNNDAEKNLYITSELGLLLCELQKTYESYALDCNIIDGKITILLDCLGDLFEFEDITKSLQSVEALKTICKQVTVIQNLVKYFDGKSNQIY